MYVIEIIKFVLRRAGGPYLRLSRRRRRHHRLHHLQTRQTRVALRKVALPILVRRRVPFGSPHRLERRPWHDITTAGPELIRLRWRRRPRGDRCGLWRARRTRVPRAHGFADDASVPRRSRPGRLCGRRPRRLYRRAGSVSSAILRNPVRLRLDWGSGISVGVN